MFCLAFCTWTSDVNAQSITPPSSPSCNGGFLWENNIDLNNLEGSNGIPQSDLRFVDYAATSFTIPGPYPVEFNSAVTINISEAISWDGYSTRANTGNQPNEQWRVVFRKNGATVYTSSYTGDLATGVKSAEWSGSLGSNIYLANGVDEIILAHYENGTYGTGSSSSANSVVPVSICLSYTPACDNVTNPGQIGEAQSGCTPFDPATITSLSDPSGGSGALEYVWLKSYNGGSSYTVISGANSSTYDPPSITETTWYRRCARRSGCSSYVGESNWVQVTLGGGPCFVPVEGELCFANPDDAGTVNAQSIWTSVWSTDLNGSDDFAHYTGANICRQHLWF